MLSMKRDSKFAIRGQPEKIITGKLVLSKLDPWNTQ